MALSELPRLRAFALVLDLGSVSAAADVLGYTQSAVSQQLAALEREAGTPLVDRSQRPLRPTPAGAALRPHAQRALSALGGAEAALEGFRRGTRRLRVTAFPSALSSFVPAAVRDLRRAHPDMVVRVDQFETREAIDHLRAGDADLAVVHYLPGAQVPETGGLASVALHTDELRAVVPAGHRLARLGAISIADLDGEPLLVPRPHSPAGRFRAVVEHLFAQAEVTPQVVFEIDDLPAAHAFVAAGIAVALMHGLTLATLPPGVVVRPLTERSAGSRAIEAIVPSVGRTEIVEELLERLVVSARAVGAPG